MENQIDKYVDKDDALFHYTNLRVGIENILHEKKLKPSLYIDTNDPREYKFLLLNRMGSEWSEETKRLWADAHPVIDRILKYHYKVMCFSSNGRPTLIINNNEIDEIEDPYAVTTGWSKSRMWTQYGENHRGLCIVFSKTAIEKMIQDVNLPAMSSKRDYVKYSPSERIRMVAYTINVSRLKQKGVENYCKNHVLKHINDFFFTKHVDYRDENEYRVVIYDPEKIYEYFYINSIIKGVIAGDRTPKVYLPIIEKQCEALNIECRRIEWDRGKPHLLLCNKPQTAT
ncbi:MAG: DUF2971 domain-containing protein [Candidatus Marinimicrobia bacterium]|nr:DUF2971 domain-containing protein [Candidatus Neomarinimicrobiota bacterium]